MPCSTLTVAAPPPLSLTSIHSYSLGRATPVHLLWCKLWLQVREKHHSLPGESMLEGLCARIAAAHVPTVCVYTRLFLPLQNVNCSSEALSSRNPRRPKITEAYLTRAWWIQLRYCSWIIQHPQSEFSTKEEEEEEEVNNSSTSRGDLDSDLAAGLLSLVLIRQQAAAAEEEEGCSCQQEEEEYSQKPFHPGGSNSSWEGTKSSSCGSNGFSHKRRQQQQGKEEDPTTTKCSGRSWTDWAWKNTDNKEELKDSNTSTSHTTFDKV